jgi:hypothetical protein
MVVNMRQLPEQDTQSTNLSAEPTLRHKKARPPGDPSAPRDLNLPPWLPTGKRLAKLPPVVREAIPRVIIPAYRQFVLDVPNETERSTGATLVYLMWLELCSQIRLAVAAADSVDLDPILQDTNAAADCDDMIDRYLHLATIKGQTTELLVKLRMVNQALPHALAAPASQSLLPSPSGRGVGGEGGAVHCPSSPILSPAAGASADRPITPTAVRTLELESQEPADQPISAPIDIRSHEIGKPRTC